MRLVRTLFLIFLAIILVVISLANSENVSLYLLPTDLSSLMGTTISINIPVFLVFFSGIFIGLIIGFLWEWLREHKFRVEANLNEKSFREQKPHYLKCMQTIIKEMMCSHS